METIGWQDIFLAMGYCNNCRELWNWTNTSNSQAILQSNFTEPNFNKRQPAERKEGSVFTNVFYKYVLAP
jgi:hypothetical protein